jgi:serine/threonine-protein kinase
MPLPDPPALPPPPPLESPSTGPARAFQTQIGGVAGDGKKLCPSCEARYPDDFALCPRDGSPLAVIDNIIGTTLSGTYFVRRLLGEGAMGRVYEARHTRIPAKRFAIKMLQPEYLAEPQILARFAQEGEAAATINHPNVVAIIDVDRTPDGRPFLVTELLEGKEFGEHLVAIGKMPVARAVRITGQIAEALVAAHARGIIHRDMKPENVFLTGDLAAPTAKILDFGMSRLDRREGKVVTTAGAVLGTPSFMPPEQARGDRVDHRADVYAVGAILYTALTGKRPFDRDENMATLLAVLNEEPPRPRALDPGIPEALERIILRAMARDPEQRYATMDELRGALAAFESGSVTAGSPAGGPSPPSSGRVRAMQTLPDADDRLLGAARPALALVLAAAFGWAGAALVAAIAALVRAAHAEGDALSGGESAVVIVVVLALLGAPLFLAVREIRRGIWDNPVRGAAIVRRAAPSVLGALVVYGAGSAAVRALELTLLAHGTRGAWSGWDLTLLVFGLLGAGLPELLRWAEQGYRAKRVAP